jgi:hypothetical protein
VQQPLQPHIDYAVLEQINEFSRKTKAAPDHVINEALRLWLDAGAAAELKALGLEPLTPRFDGTAGYGRRKVTAPSAPVRTRAIPIEWPHRSIEARTTTEPTSASSKCSARMLALDGRRGTAQWRDGRGKEE